MLPLARLERLLEQFDRLPDLLAAKCDLTETGERGCARRIAGLQVSAVEALGLVDLAEPECDLRLDELQRLERLRVHAGREPLAGDVDPQGELVDHLERRHPGSGLDPRDVGRGAAGERELALRQARPLARCLQADSDLAGRVDVGRQGPGHRRKSSCLWSSVLTRHVGFPAMGEENAPAPPGAVNSITKETAQT